MECFRHSFNEQTVLDARYRPISPLNHGSFGMVFMAQDIESEKPVAIKCLTNQFAASDAGLDFAVDDQSEELALHSRIGSHPNIVNLMHSFVTDAHTFLVLEYCHRGDLYEAIRHNQGPLETEHVRRFMLQLVDAVAYIHSKGIYHRDIKPENIFLTQDGSMKLGDFGLATTDKWTFENTVGSDRYMSPEQYDSDGAGYSPAQADIWAIGICLLNVLFSRNPFSTPTEADPLFLDFSRDSQSLFDVFQSMSQDTYEVIVQCMNLDPSKRSLAGVRDALLRAVSFTILDEALDDFCSEERLVIASANREPLRTPSIQSPPVDVGAFPWAEALRAPPHKPLNNLYDNLDDGNYLEDLFSRSEGNSFDWASGTAQTPSASSVLDSNRSPSPYALQPTPSVITRKSQLLHFSGKSDPIVMAKLPVQYVSTFTLDRKDVAKSWSDMWDEDAEEEEARVHQLKTLREMNTRTWSHESAAPDYETPRQSLTPVSKGISLEIDPVAISIDETITTSDVDDDSGVDGFFFHKPIAQQQSPHSPGPCSPSKRVDLDKWAALGERRRAHSGNTPQEVVLSSNTKPEVDTTELTPYRAATTEADHRSKVKPCKDIKASLESCRHEHARSNWNSTSKQRATECSWNKGRIWDRSAMWRKERRPYLFDWVGGWHKTLY